MRAQRQFEDGLIQLDMLVPDALGSSGLVFIDKIPINDYERIALDKAKKYDVDAVYFRRFEDGRASIPQIYIYDFTTRDMDDNEMGELHRKLWNSGQVPLFFIFSRTEIKVFNCLKSPGFDPDTDTFTTSPLEIISLAEEVESELDKRKLKEFSARRFDNGSFWDMSEYRDEFKLDDSSYETLLRHLKKIRSDIVKKEILAKPIVQKLLVMSILIKYLEEREDREGNTVFPADFFGRFAEGAKCFTDLLKKKGACLELFDNLSQKFNGEIFQWENANERALLSRADLTRFAGFFEARTDISGQGTLWPLYSFNDLPIELISNIYEEFLGNQRGVVYTPPYLVHFLIDEAMPLNSPLEEFKVLDPACGSGVFLVAAYQRIIDWWRIRNDWQQPDLDTLKVLLSSSIYGVDISPEAVRLTIFSLSLVLLDELSPKEIWENLKFDNLKQLGNLYEKDFFELILDREITKQFDLVIGNPPFVTKINTRSAKAVDEKMREERAPIPYNQLALLFLEQSLGVCKSGSLLCFILPSGPLLYNWGSFAFRKYLLETCYVKQILDFTFLREILFGSANAAAAALFAKNEPPESRQILHVTFRRTKLTKEKIYLELGHYDLHHVAHEDAVNNRLVWKANFLGGGRLFHLILRLSKPRKFGDYLKERIKKDGWVSGEGFQEGRKGEIDRLKAYTAGKGALTLQEKDELKRLQKKFKKSDHLTGSRTLPTDAFTENGIDETQIHILEEEFFQWDRKKNKLIFHGPHLLIKEEAARHSIPIAFRDDDLSFRDDIIGIHANETYREELIQIEKRIKENKVILFCAYAFSGKHLVDRGVKILKRDIEDLPFPGDESELDLSKVEKILVDDVLEYMLDFRNRGENSKILQPVNRAQLRFFGETYCQILNTVYDKFKSLEPVVTDHFVCFCIFYGEEPQEEIGDPEQFEKYLNQLVYKESGKNLRVVRVLRVYDKNMIYLVKPKQARYWLRSVAVRDADETFEDLIKQGY